MQIPISMAQSKDTAMKITEAVAGQDLWPQATPRGARPKTVLELNEKVLQIKVRKFNFQYWKKSQMINGL